MHSRKIFSDILIKSHILLSFQVYSIFINLPFQCLVLCSVNNFIMEMYRYKKCLKGTIQLFEFFNLPGPGESIPQEYHNITQRVNNNIRQNMTPRGIKTPASQFLT